MLLLMLAILLPVPLSLGEVNDTMFVMPEGQISDFTARLTLARLLSMQDDRLLEAEAEYRTLMADDQANVAVLLELSRLLKRLDKTTEAAAILQTIFEQLKNNPLPDRQLAEIYMEQADLETGLGHVEPCRRLYRKALELTDNDDEVRLRFADQMNMWGDFHEIEKIFRALLNEQPDNHEIRLKLAGTLASMERFAEAEGIYLALLQENSDRTAEILLGLADVSFKENNLPATIARVDKLLQHAGPVAKHSEDILLAGLRLKGDALFKLERYQEALQIYTELAGSKPGMIEGLVSQGRVYIRLQEMEKARDVFHRLVTSYPDNLEAGLSLAILNADDPLSPLETIKSTKPTAAMKLVVLGRLYGVQGLYNAAAASFKAALDRDPQCFPASLGLAESLAADNRFEQAVDLLQQLQQTYPDNHKLNITMARVLAWSKQYNKAILVYDTIHALQPDNPVPVTEKARTAVWGKKMAEAQTTYKTLWKTPVDQQLFSRLAAIDSHEADELSQAMARLNNTVDNDSIYTGYEQVAAKLDTLRSSLSDEQADRVHRAVLELQPAYRIQKSASLESRAKKLSWDKRFTPSMKTYEELLSFQPGNQEALFDYAQVQCALGMCDREKDTYEHLLNINPWHSLAQTALDRQRARGNPGIAAGQSYWEEEGRGELSQIARHRMDLILDLPLFCRYHLRFLGHHWQEEPKHRGGHYTAGGQTIEFNGVINPYLSGAVAWTGKDYSRDTIPDRETGHGRLSLNLQNYARVNLGFERTDELYNDFRRDITDRKNDEKNLVNSEERFRLLTESSREGVCIHDKGIILDVNSAFAAIFGYDRKELIGKKILDLAAPESRDLVRAKTLSGFDEPYEAMGITKDGSIIFGELHGKEIPYMGGKARVSSIRDLTKTRKMEQEVQKIHKLESIGILAGGIAHDFNNLLTAILGNISLAKIFAKDNAKVLERLGHAENASGRAQDLTQQLLTFSKGGAPIKRTASIADLIRDSASFILSGANVNCDLQIAGNLWPVSVDEGQISQVIQNLVKNADQAMPDGGTITILAENTEIDPKDSLPLQNGNYVKITIRDLGVGIMKKHLAKVFDPFFSTKQEGSGLGLAVAYSIIKKHDGLIMVESEPGHGTTFQIFLPASAEPVPSREPAKTDPSISGGRILIMDDEAAVLKVASSMLEIMGYKCAVASNGSDAVSLYRQAKNAGRPFDAVILDLTVPGGMGGRETLQQLKKIDPDVRSIVSSGYANDPIMADSADYGFMGVVEKPYDMRQLGDALRKLLG